MTATLLDHVVDRIIAGDTPTLYLWEPDCQWPNIAAGTGYWRGCRCPRCRAGHASYERRQVIARAHR